MGNDPFLLTPAEHAVLAILIGVPKAFGLEIVRASDGQVSRASVYVLLGRLQDKGFVESEYAEPERGDRGPRRRIYKITGVGQRALRAWQQSVAAWQAVSS